MAWFVLPIASEGSETGRVRMMRMRSSRPPKMSAEYLKCWGSKAGRPCPKKKPKRERAPRKKKLLTATSMQEAITVGTSPMVSKG